MRTSKIAKKKKKHFYRNHNTLGRKTSVDQTIWVTKQSSAEVKIKKRIKKKSLNNLVGVIVRIMLLSSTHGIKCSLMKLDCSVGADWWGRSTTYH